MRLDFLCEYTTTYHPGISLERGPLGERLVVDISGGHFEGPRFTGKVRASGAAWMLLCEGGYRGRIDVRTIFETDDGAYVYVTYGGRLEMNRRIQAALSGSGSSEYGDSYFIIQMQFETGDSRYIWMNDVLAVGEGRLEPGAVTYRIYCLEPN